MRDPGRVVIIGAGPTGLGAAHRLSSRGHGDYRIVEAADRPGGLAASYRDAAGFTWDVGGHVHHSHYPAYDEIVEDVLGERRLVHERTAAVWLQGRFIPYPFQYNLHRLDEADCLAALRDLERSHAAGPPDAEAAFDEWLIATFGETISRLFMTPYNRKVWGYPLAQLSSHWIADRVAVPDLDRVRRNVRELRDDVSWGPNRRFYYPREGGTGAIWRGLAERLPTQRLSLRSRVVSVDIESRSVAVAGGRRYPYDTLISSMPLDLLCRSCSGLDPALVDTASKLLHSAVHVIGVGLRGGRPELLDGLSWIYFPEPAAPFYRLTVLSDYSPFNTPPGDGFWSLLLEVCETPVEPIDGATIGADCLRYLRSAGFVTPQATVVSLWHRRAEHGYPTPFRGRDRTLRCLLDALEVHDIYSRGRFGAWMYEVSNQDHCFMQGVELVDRLLDGSPEPTIESPAEVNRRVASSARTSPGSRRPRGQPGSDRRAGASGSDGRR